MTGERFDLGCKNKVAFDDDASGCGSNLRCGILPLQFWFADHGFLIFMVIMTSTAAMESSQFSSSGDDTDGWLFVPKPMNHLQSVGAIVAGAVSLLVAWSLGSRFGYASGLEESVTSTSTTTDGAVTNGGAIDGTTLVVAILVLTVFYLFKVNYNLKNESLLLREELAGAQQPEASGDANDDFDEREVLKDQVVTLRDKVAHLTQCLVGSEEKAQEFKYEIKIHLGAKRDLAKENRNLRQQLEAADRELTRARERAVPPERVVVTGKGRCFHHVIGCHHIYRNYNQTHINR